MRPIQIVGIFSAALLFAACGNNSGGGTIAPTGDGGTAPSVVGVVDDGPVAAGGDVNTLFVSIKICAPGSSTLCQTVDHVQVDTGSTGFRVLASAIGTGVTSEQLTQAVDPSGNPYVECAQFADGYSWGPVKLADLTIGSGTISSVPIQVIGDADYSTRTIPDTCSSNVDVPENTVMEFGANGLLGVGNYLQDCGSYCTSGAQDGSIYNVCPTATSPACQPSIIATASQVQNPIALLPANNNGVVIQLPAVSLPGAATTSGSLIFGVGTGSNNGLGRASVYTLDDYGNFSTNLSGVGNFDSSFLDTGSTGYYFDDNNLTACSGDASDFYCPASTTALSATITGMNGTSGVVTFNVDNADNDFNTNDTAMPGLAGSAGSGLGMDTFDWGLPFFYGRSVYVVFENNTAIGSGVVGPYVAF